MRKLLITALLLGLFPPLCNGTTFDFSQANGTTLESIDSKWEGASTFFNAQSGQAEITACGGGTVRDVRYENGQGNTQSGQALVKAAATSTRRAIVTQRNGSQQGYEARFSGTTDIEIRRNGTYVTQGTIASGNTTTTDYTVKITSNASTGAVTVWAASGSVADAQVSGTQIVTTTDGTPLTGGYPGFSLACVTLVSEVHIDDWTDFEAVGGSIVISPLSGGGGAAARPITFNILPFTPARSKQVRPRDAADRRRITLQRAA